MTPEEKKQYRDRANRARRALLKEKEEHGYIHDGSGKRYEVPIYYVLAGQHNKALEFYSWFESEFPDDVGEPLFALYWALAALRADQTAYARYRLQNAMLGNLYILPFLFREPIKTLDIWHWSNWADNNYLNTVADFLDEPTEEERQWIKNEYNTPTFSILRDKYIFTYHHLKHERDTQKRHEILEQWKVFSEPFLENPC